MSEIECTKSNTKEELLDLFISGKPLSGIKITFSEKNKKRIYHKPFGNVLATNKHTVLQGQDFNGEPFLRGKFEYMQVLLPEKRSVSLFHFYPVLKAILNGYHICTKAKKERLTALANEIYYHYAPIKHAVYQTEERMDSFQKIEDIIDKIIAKPMPFNGRKKYETIIWNPDYDLSPYEKTCLTNKDSGKALVDKNIQTLLEVYTEGMTKKELLQKTSLSRSTVFRRWNTLLEVYNQNKILQAA